MHALLSAGAGVSLRVDRRNLTETRSGHGRTTGDSRRIQLGRVPQNGSLWTAREPASWSLRVWRTYIRRGPRVATGLRMFPAPRAVMIFGFATTAAAGRYGFFEACPPPPERGLLR